MAAIMLVNLSEGKKLWGRDMSGDSVYEICSTDR